jgi:hypothetical protein
MRFTLYEHSFHPTNIFYKITLTTTFLVFENSRNGKNASLVLFLSLENLGILPQVYKSVMTIFVSRTPFGFDQLLYTNLEHLSLIYLFLCDQPHHRIIYKVSNKFEGCY